MVSSSSAGDRREDLGRRYFTCAARGGGRLRDWDRERQEVWKEVPWIVWVFEYVIVIGEEGVGGNERVLRKSRRCLRIFEKLESDTKARDIIILGIK